VVHLGTKNHQKQNIIDKVMAPKVEGVKIQKTNHETSQRLVPEYSKNILYVVLLLFEFKVDL
jgi:hypothetical protein